MPKNGNVADSTTVRVTVSVQSEDLLQQLASKGIYGRNPSEVAARFIDDALKLFVGPVKLKLASTPKGNRGKP